MKFVLLFPTPVMAADNISAYNYLLYGSLFLLCLSVVLLIFRAQKDNKSNIVLNELYNREKLNQGMLDVRARALLGRIEDEISIHDNHHNLSLQIIRADLLKFIEVLHSDFIHLENPDKMLDEISSRFYRTNDEIHSHESVALKEVDVRSMNNILLDAIHRHADRLRISKNEIFYIFNHDVIHRESLPEEEFWFLVFEANKTNEMFLEDESGECLQAIISKGIDNSVEVFFVKNT